MSRVWRIIPPSPDAQGLAHAAGISLIEAQLLINRGISDENALASFLSPRLSHLLDPMLMKDMDEAVSLVMSAIEHKEPITIYGDFDADGLTATAVLVNFLAGSGVPASYYIPNRLTEGYGLNPAAVESISRSRGGLVITVDCGTSNLEEISLLRKMGMKVVVTDHHQLPEDFKPLCPVINPHRPDSSFPFKDLSGVGIAFFLAIALRAALRGKGWFRNRKEPDLRDYLDLVAIGTVADMVPLLDQNRILVSTGMEKMRDSLWPGIKAIGEVSDLGPSSPASADDLAFRFAPRLNASGRLGDAETGIQILTTTSLSSAKNLASKLNVLNSQRQGIEQEVIRQIEEVISTLRDLEERRTLVFSGKGWHRGVLGIVASRLVERYHRPALVMNIEDGMAVGSGRSIQGFNLHKALTRLKPLLKRFGGHHHAAGFTLEVSNLEAFAEELEAIARHEIHPDSLIPTTEVDAEMTLSSLDLETVDRIRSLAPFGNGNPEPLFHVPSLEVVESRVLGEKHLKLKVREGRTVLEAIGFGLAAKHPYLNRRINVVCAPEIRRWQGNKKVQLRITDLEEEGQHQKLRISS
jgi:single-stranded-DNA-specific exonuclease